jgi:hypothetical protein
MFNSEQGDIHKGTTPLPTAPPQTRLTTRSPTNGRYSSILTYIIHWTKTMNCFNTRRRMVQRKGNEEYCFLGYDVIQTGRSPLMFWMDIPHASSRSQSKPSNQQEPGFNPEAGGTKLLQNVTELQATECHIPDESTLHSHRCENLVSHPL